MQHGVLNQAPIREAEGTHKAEIEGVAKKRKVQERNKFFYVYYFH